MIAQPLGATPRCRAIVALLLVLLSACGAQALLPGLRDDIIFQTSRSGQSPAIQRATASPYSHVGIIFHRNGKPFVFEARFHEISFQHLVPQLTRNRRCT
ncbi:MAG: YiiX/YebB-like N1pC/P60 family cysteine hydrolase [Myxococcales bacterium]|jgi:hypothetical protein